MAHRRRTTEEKVRAVERLEQGESSRDIAADLGVSFTQVYRWRNAFRSWGRHGLEPGNQSAARRGDAPVSAGPAGRVGSEAARIAALERKIGAQALELDFLAGALRHVEASRRAKGLPSVTASTSSSGRKRSGKAD
jgi:transposase-like protein